MLTFPGVKSHVLHEGYHVRTTPDTQHPHRTPNKLRSRAPAMENRLAGAAYSPRTPNRLSPPTTPHTHPDCGRSKLTSTPPHQRCVVWCVCRASPFRSTFRPPPPIRRETATGLRSFKMRDSGRHAPRINAKGCTWACLRPESRHNASESKPNECAG